LAKDNGEVAGLRAENEALRKERDELIKIAAFVPASVYINAREQAGFGVHVSIKKGDIA
jgi:hypothetical protein